MIVILNDQLFQLTDAVLVCIRILIHHTDKRDLCPYDKSHFVTGIIEVLRMLIMCQSNRICSQFFDHSCIFIMIFFCQCVSFIQHVLMTAHSTQRSLCTIEDEPFVRITGKAAHSNTCRDLIIRLISSLLSLYTSMERQSPKVSHPEHILLQLSHLPDGRHLPLRFLLHRKQNTEQ